MFTKWLIRTSLFSFRGFSYRRENWQSRYESLTDLSNFTTEKVTNLIRDYYIIHKGARQDGVMIKWESDQKILNSLRYLSSIIKILNKDQIVLLIRNLTILEIREHEIWTYIEKSLIIKCIKELSAEDIVAVVQSMSSAGKRNFKVWTMLEEVLNEKILPSVSYTAARSTSLLLGFKTVQRGSEEFFKKIIMNVVEKKEELTCRDIGKIVKACQFDNKVPEEFLEVLSVKADEFKEEFDEIELQRILSFMVKHNANEKFVVSVQNQVLATLEKFSLYNLSVICFAYAKFKEKEIQAPGVFQDFLNEIERFYGKKGGKIENRLRDKDENELRLMWSLSKTNSFIDKTLWINYRQKLENDSNLRRNNFDIVESLEKTLKENILNA